MMVNHFDREGGSTPQPATLESKVPSGCFTMVDIEKEMQGENIVEDTQEETG